LADKLYYFKCDWVKGAQKQTKVESIKLSQNDIISFRIINVNNFVFEVEILQQEITAEKKDSPFKTILSAFTGMGGPALNLLTSLGDNSPKPLTGNRGGNKEIEEYKKQCNETIIEMHQVITKIVKSYASIEKNTKVLYSKNKTKAEILFELKQNKEKTNADEIETDYDYLLELNNRLEELLAQDILEFDDPFLDEIEKVEKLYSDFENTCLTEEKQLKPYDISEIISEVEKSSFKVEHRFIAEEGGGYNGKNTSNDFLLVFKERLIGEKANDDEIALPIDFAKYLSIPVKQPYLPYWSIGVDYVIPIGGFKEYDVQEIEGDTWQGIPDSLLITSSNSGLMKLGIGTKLTFDLASKNKFISPNVVIGVALFCYNNFLFDTVIFGPLKQDFFSYKVIK
jgi:hypothetical protein